MNLEHQIINHKEEYYRLATEYYNNIEAEHRTDIAKITPKSIAILIDHEFIPTPCIEIRMELFQRKSNKGIGFYSLYIDQEPKFVDEFLIIND